ncbi:hypothetical protein EGN72_13785 [Pseudorhodobacter sp. E13]|uniref:hypothetical protein n=1 Tax=Pseudorhodobacter sp. E13 TaxID=2487931 RepID=UPI000F8ED06B|nr:hypothetical protein [Pseudorhodobacter sp. E13]RUS59758.1 hypothetical protein EGN72_13785 [Pseudorhodobacter sp. E13]
MTRKKDLARLASLSGLILDQKLAVLQSLAAEREASLQRLRDLAQNNPGKYETPQDAQVALRYNRWADARRADINITLARQTAEWLDARAEAKHAFGRAEVLRQLQGKEAK